MLPFFSVFKETFHHPSQVCKHFSFPPFQLHTHSITVSWISVSQKRGTQSSSYFMISYMAYLVQIFRSWYHRMQFVCKHRNLNSFLRVRNRHYRNLSAEALIATNTIRPCRSSRGQSLASHRSGPDSIPCRVLWDLWWAKWHRGRFSPSTSVSPAISNSTNVSVFINLVTLRYIVSILTVLLNKPLKKYSLRIIALHHDLNCTNSIQWLLILSIVCSISV
jgi:hypothetical protein